MTDQQIISIAITLFAIAAGSLFNNVRISDSNNSTARSLDQVNKRIDDLRDFIKAETSHIDQKLDRISETLATVVADHEARLRELEHKQ